MKSFRQGDVLLIAVRSIPKDVAPVVKDMRGIVLMEGELSGHHHRFADNGDAALLERSTGERFVIVTAPVALIHEEHDAIMFACGKFRQCFQVEDYGDEVRHVAD